MLTYEQWDYIADAYIPILVLAIFLQLVRHLKDSDIQPILPRLKVLVLSVLFVYILMSLDSMLNLWPSLGWDYSTHTALALALVYYLIQSNKRFAITLAVSMGLYGVLMIYQAYHTIYDIISTVTVVMPILWLIYRRFGDGIEIKTR